MKKEEIPQDDGALNKLTKEVVYAVDGSGKYSSELSTKQPFFYQLVLNVFLIAAIWICTQQLRFRS